MSQAYLFLQGGICMSQSIGQKFTPAALIKFAFPSMIMMVFMSLYTITDGIFISRFLGDHALSASNIVFPLLSVLLALSIMLATGGSAIVASKMGAGKQAEARSDFSMITASGAVISVLFLIPTLLFLRPICALMGSNELLLPHCCAYLGTLTLFAPACMLQSLFQCFFVTAGKPHIGLVLTLMGGIANAALDYVFLGPLGFGIEGAAIATGIGQAIPAVFGLFYFSLVKKDLYFTKFKFHPKTFFAASANGSSEMVTHLSNAVVTYLFNVIMMDMAGESGVAAITILLYAQFLFNALYLGFSMGVAPVFSFHHGASNHSELQNVYKISMWFVLASSMGITVLSYLSSDFISGIFVAPGTETYFLTVEGFALFSLSFLFSGFNIFASALFTALSDGKTSAIISFTRTFGCILLSLLTLPAVLGLNGVWLAIPVAEFLTVFLSGGFHAGKRNVYHYVE